MTPRKPTDDWLDDAWRYAFPWIGGAFLICTFVIVPIGSLAISIFGYLRSGEWQNISLGTLTVWRPASDWVGLNEVVNWALALWIGAPSLAIGGLALWIYISQDSP